MHRNKNNKSKPIIGISLSNLEYHHIDMENLSIEIWNELSDLFGPNEPNGNFPLAL